MKKENIKLLNNCNLCPRNCNINRFKNIGVCGANSNIKIARADLYMYEEPVISGNNGSGTIFFSNCNMKCIYCQNEEISINGFGKEINIDKFSDICIDLQNKKANNINLVTPTMYIPQIIEGIELAKKKGLNIPVIYNTSGYEKKESINKLNNTVDIYLTDFRYFNDEYGEKYSKVNNYTKYAKESLKEMYKQTGPFIIDNNIMKKGIIVRILIIPGLIEDAKNIIKYLYETYGNNIILSIMNQYTPMKNNSIYSILNNKITEEDYNEIINYACDLGIVNAFIQEDETQSKSFIPTWDLTGL